jgi:hypothetical protein
MMGCVRHYDIRFLNQPVIKPYEKFDFKLAEPFEVQIKTKRPRTSRLITIRKGFVTDLASVPRIMWACYSPNDARTIPAAILHDYLYRYKLDFTRKEVDDMFYFALVKGHTKPRTALKYYIGVRLFGWMFYQKKGR